MSRGFHSTVRVAAASTVRPRPHVTSWADLIATYIGSTHRTEAVGRDEGFFGELTNWYFGPLTFVLSRVRGVSVRGIQADDETALNPDDAWLCMSLAGSFEIDAGRRCTVIGPSRVAVMRCGRPHVVTFAPDCDVLWVRAPRYHFRSLEQNSAGFVVLDAASGVGRLALQSLRGLCEQAAVLDDEDAGQIVHSTLGLVSAALENTARLGSEPELMPASPLEQLKQFIENNLHDERLSLATAARHLGRSPRHINRIFEAAGESFMRFTWNRRLERARARIRAAGDSSESITDIALSCGFKNLSHFSRAFRQRFACTPSAMLQGVRNRH